MIILLTTKFIICIFFDLISEFHFNEYFKKKIFKEIEFFKQLYNK
jgi:hypothetical protein